MNNVPSVAGKTTGKIMMIAAWLIGMLWAIKFFAAWEADQRNPNKDPQSSYKKDYNEVTLESGRAGHYLANGYINGQSVVLLLDTGASQVSVSEAIASRLNLKKGMSIEVDTANGLAKGWMTTLNDIRLGTIKIDNIPATILPNMTDEVLLGMNFLRELELIRHRDGQLTLRQYKSNE